MAAGIATHPAVRTAAFVVASRAASPPIRLSQQGAMAADSEPESEVFEITDFTTASEWERFISRVEEVLNDWKLIGQSPSLPVRKGEYTTGTWEEETEEVMFANFRFSVIHHYLKQESIDGKEARGEAAEDDDALPEAMQDLVSMDNDFSPRAHCLVRWNGLRNFVIIAPSAASEAVITESKCNLLLSSVSIALGNTGCQVPVFVQIQQKWRRMFSGLCEGPGVRTDFEMVHLRKAPNHYNHLSGLLDVFKSKIACPLSHIPPVSVSIRFTYVLQDCQQYSWPQPPPDFDALVGGEVGALELGKLPFGACEDPVSELHLAATWPHLTEDIIVDNDVYSDLDPVQAPQWSVRVRMADNPQCLLGDFLYEFHSLCHRKESTDELLGKAVFDDEAKEGADISQALQRLTEPVPVHMPTLSSMSSMVQGARKRIRSRRPRASETPIPNALLNSMLLYLFPDAADKSAESPDAKATCSVTTAPVTEDDEMVTLHRSLKSAPADSLTHKLALCLCTVNYQHGGLKGVAHLWQEFVLEMRYRWENNYIISGLTPGPPDYSCCLLHQKLQMLNCCIERKKSREERQRESSSAGGVGRAGGSDTAPSTSKNGRREAAAGRAGERQQQGGTSAEMAAQKPWDSWSEDSEDEFFECESDLSDGGEGAEEGEEGSTEGTRQSGTGVTNEDNASKVAERKEERKAAAAANATAQRKPDGRLHQHGEITLIESGEPLYIPITQEPAPMTEDMLEEQTEVLAKLGTSAEGAHLRARMQSACLLSDMESFKAANPGCRLEDFVRWYSPRDYEEVPPDEDAADSSELGAPAVAPRGRLSARMQLPGNVWVEAWEATRPIPARRQRRLFDDTREAEKVLHYLAGMRPADVTLQLLPCAIHAALLKVKEESSEDVPTVNKLLKASVSLASRILRHPNPDPRRLEEVISQVTLAEAVIARGRSLRAKFAINTFDKEEEKTELERFVSSLLEEPEVPVFGAGRGPAGSIIHRLFMSAQQVTSLTPVDEDRSLAAGTAGGSEERRGAAPASTAGLAGGSAQGGQGNGFPAPRGREFILRCTVPRPAPYSRALPHRMFCVLSKDQFTLAGAFSSDTSFY
uniref:Rab3 GTPase-activating protein catalytic subunit n=1 Tax=Petromyzon marinus TaxID=7757 RepID=A0AAJ7WY60_PETMA|nr:rab3 GTPase-activating protein catalytic subunit isoform X2 [Petromyzon marinus]